MQQLHFGIVGDFQSGKSTLINCLLKRPIAKVGEGASTTHTIVNYKYAEIEHIELVYSDGITERIDAIELNGKDTREDIKEIDVFINNDFLKDKILTDMPGFGFNESDNKASESIIKKIDYAIVVMTNHKAIEEESSYSKDIQRLKSNAVPYYIIINSSDFSSEKWYPSHSDNVSIAKRDFECISFYRPLQYPFEEKKIPIVNFMWYWFAIMGNSGGVVCRYWNLLKNYGLMAPDIEKAEIIEASNFELVNKIFNMDNRAYLELRKDFKNEIQRLKNELCPIGTIQTFAFSNIPQGWLMCNGAKLDIESFPELFKMIGLTFGGDGEQYFNIPDLQGMFVRGCDSGRKIGSKQEDAIQEHGHNLDMESNRTKDGGKHDHYIGYKNDYFSYGTISGNTGSCRSVEGHSEPHVLSYGDDRAIHSHELPNMKVVGPTSISLLSPVRTAKETRPKNIALMYCIKAK